VKPQLFQVESREPARAIRELGFFEKLTRFECTSLHVVVMEHYEG